MTENDLYHADPDISKSHLDVINESPLHYYHKYLSGQYKRTGNTPDHFVIGTAAHTYILEPNKIENELVVMPPYMGTGSRNKIKEFRELHIDKTIVKLETMQHVKGMRQAVFNHPVARKLLTSVGVAEKRFNWVYKSDSLDENGKPFTVKCKIKPDWLTDDYMVDLKTIDSLSKVKKNTYTHRYHVQGAFYLDGLKFNNINVKGAMFIFVEKTPPYEVAVYYMAKNSPIIGEGRDAYIEDLETLIECSNSGVWVDNEIKSFDLL